MRHVLSSELTGLRASTRVDFHKAEVKNVAMMRTSKASTVKVKPAKMPELASKTVFLTFDMRIGTWTTAMITEPKILMLWNFFLDFSRSRCLKEAK